MSQDEIPEIETSICSACGKPVQSYWTSKGCLSRPLEYVLIADWIFHTPCWDKMVKDHPP